MPFDCFQCVHRSITFAHQFAAPPPPSLSTHIEVLVILAAPVKKLSKMLGNSASYPFNSCCIQCRLTMNTYRIMANCIQAYFFSFQYTVLRIIKIGISKCYNCAWKQDFLKSGHISRFSQSNNSCSNSAV